MDLNHVLLWISTSTCLLLGGRLLAARAWGSMSWVLVSALVLLAQGAAYLAWPARAGFVGAALCGLLVLAPMAAATATMRQLGRERYAAARRLAWFVRVLHPSRVFRNLPRQIDVLEQLRRDGAIDPRVLAELPASTPLGRFVHLQSLRAAGRFDELRRFIAGLAPEVRASDVGLAAHEVRALAELGEIDAMLQVHARVEADPAFVSVRSTSRLFVAARLGRVDLVDRLLHGAAGRVIPEAAAEYWRATALQVAGDPGATQRLRALTARDPDVAGAARRRLVQPFGPVELAALSPAAQATVQALAREIESAEGLTAVSGRRTASQLLLASFVVVFAFELPGGATDNQNLADLGALLIPRISGYDELWRLLTAAWLHYGSLHLMMNGLGLWTLGRPIEAVFGPVRTFVLFVASALAGNVAALLLLSGPTLLVGASGGVLGMLGALVAVTLLRLRKTPTQFLRAQLRGVLVVIGMQVAFDLTTPSVSSVAHAFGFGAGVVLGAVLMPKLSARV